MPKNTRRPDSAQPVALTPAPDDGREVVYDHVHCLYYLRPEQLPEGCATEYRGPMNAETMKSILGWREAAPGETPLLKDRKGKAIVCDHNTKNRPLDLATAEAYCQDVLNRNWADSAMGPGCTTNGEPVILSRYGEVVSGQHRGVGLILAAQRWDEEEHWRDEWPDGPPTIETVVTVGVSEDPRVIRTIDNVQERTLEDVLWTGPLFRGLKPAARKAAVAAVNYGVRFLWHRTGADADAYSPRRTHSESLDFIDRHPTLLDCVRWCATENESGKLSKFLTPGTAAGLMYLMAATDSDGDAYRDAEPRGEAGADLGKLDDAQAFFSLLINNGPEFKVLRNAKVTDKVDYGDGVVKDVEVYLVHKDAPLALRLATLITAWHQFRTTGKLTAAGVMPLLRVENGVHVLDGVPTCGGLDVGEPAEQPESDGGKGEGGEVPDDGGDDVVKAEVEARKAEAAAKHQEEVKEREARFKAKKAAEKAAKNGTPPKPEEKCPKARTTDGRHVFLPGPGNTPGPKCFHCGAPNPAAKGTKAPPRRGGTGK